MLDSGVPGLVAHRVAYQVDNPRYWELDDLLRSAQLVEPTLGASCDTAAVKGPLAWSGVRADGVFARLDRVRGLAGTAASSAVDQIRIERDREPLTLTRYRTEWYYERVGY